VGVVNADGLWRTGHESIPATPAWSVPSDSVGGGLTPLPSGGCVVSDSSAVAAYAEDGTRIWRAEVAGPLTDRPVIAPDGALLTVEGDTIVSRDTETGTLIHSFPARRARNLSMAPWGGLIYQSPPSGGPTTLCSVDRDGRPQWSRPLNRSSIFIYSPLALGDLVVVEGGGALWAFDRDGDVRWIADREGVRQPQPSDEAGQRTDQPGNGVQVRGAPRLIDENRAVVALGSYDGRGVYLLDGAAATLTPIAIPASPPYAVVPWRATGYRIAGLGTQVTIGPQLYEFPVCAFDPDGTPAWEHRLPVRALTLNAAPGGHVVAAATPDARRWADYHQWYDLTREAFVRLIAPDGTQRWTWHAPGRITHLPVVSPTGVVYVGAEQRLWAFDVDSAFAERVERP